MAESLEGRLKRLGWLRDGKSDSEDTLEWVSLLEGVRGVPSEDQPSLHWSVVAESLSKVSGGFSGAASRKAYMVH